MQQECFYLGTFVLTLPFTFSQFLACISQVFAQTLSSKQSPILLLKFPGVFLGFIFGHNFITYILFICLMVCLPHLPLGHWVSCSLCICLCKLNALRMLPRIIDAVSIAGAEDIISRGHCLRDTLGTAERWFPCVITLPVMGLLELQLLWGYLCSSNTLPVFWK